MRDLMDDKDSLSASVMQQLIIINQLWFIGSLNAKKYGFQIANIQPQR